MKKVNHWVLLFCVFLSVCIISACGSSSDSTKSTSTITTDLEGSWTASFDEDTCEVIQEVVFSNDATFSFHETSECDYGNSEYTRSGTWTIRNGLLYITTTYINDPDDADDIGEEDQIHYYITSAGSLGLADGGDILHLNGTINGLIGIWETDDEDSDCSTTLIIDTNTLSYDKTCTEGKDESLSGTYTVTGDMITFNVGTEQLILYFKLFGNILAVTPENYLFIPED